MLACGNEFEAAAKPNSFVNEYSHRKRGGDKCIEKTTEADIRRKERTMLVILFSRHKKERSIHRTKSADIIDHACKF